jgi:hypothetical protein
MNRSKRRSRRLALYLLCIGVRPWPADLQAQYNALEPGQRKLARKNGRRLIKEEGSIAKAMDTLTNSFVPQRDAQCSACRRFNSSPSARRGIQIHFQALVCTHAALPLLPDVERLSKAFLAHSGMG